MGETITELTEEYDNKLKVELENQKRREHDRYLDTLEEKKRELRAKFESDFKAEQRRMSQECDEKLKRMEKEIEILRKQKRDLEVDIITMKESIKKNDDDDNGGDGSPGKTLSPAKSRRNRISSVISKRW